MSKHENKERERDTGGGQDSPSLKLPSELRQSDEIQSKHKAPKAGETLACSEKRESKCGFMKSGKLCKSKPRSSDSILCVLERYHWCFRSLNDYLIHDLKDTFCC